MLQLIIPQVKASILVQFYYLKHLTMDIWVMMKKKLSSSLPNSLVYTIVKEMWEMEKNNLFYMMDHLMQMAQHIWDMQ